MDVYVCMLVALTYDYWMSWLLGVRRCVCKKQSHSVMGLRGGWTMRFPWSVRQLMHYIMAVCCVVDCCTTRHESLDAHALRWCAAWWKHPAHSTHSPADAKIAFYLKVVIMGRKMCSNDEGSVHEYVMHQIQFIRDMIKKLRWCWSWCRRRRRAKRCWTLPEIQNTHTHTHSLAHRNYEPLVRWQLNCCFVGQTFDIIWYEMWK